MRLVAYTIKGLENIVENELYLVLGMVKIVQKQDKIIIFDYEGNLENITKLRTVDDIGIFVSDLDSIDITKIQTSIDYIKTFRDINNNFSITTSIVSDNKNKDTTKDTDALVSPIIEKLADADLIYTAKDRTNLDFRIFINSNIEFLSLRLTINPLNKRNYEIGSYRGSLKPTIAAAMVQLATNNFSKEAKIVDNFCGSGTILCEAYHKGFNVFGGDINPEAIILTKKRLKMEGCLVNENLKLQDATKTKWNSSYFDCVISNLPWDKQHEVTSITDLYIGCIKEYKRILKSKFRLCIICHKPELLIKHIKKEFGNINIQRLDIGYLGQNPSIVLGTNY